MLDVYVTTRALEERGHDMTTTPFDAEALLSPADYSTAEDYSPRSKVVAWNSAIRAIQAAYDAGKRDAVRRSEAEVQAYFNASDAHEASNDGFGKSRDTYADLIEARARLRTALSQGEGGA